MYKCKNCEEDFESKCKEGYISWCSHRCWQAYTFKTNPEKIRKWRKNCWRSKREDKECAICGFSRTIDYCHIIWKKDGGKVNRDNIVILCPNHHRLYDSGKLTATELEKVEPEGKR